MQGESTVISASSMQIVGTVYLLVFCSSLEHSQHVPEDCPFLLEMTLGETKREQPCLVPLREGDWGTGPLNARHG